MIYDEAIVYDEGKYYQVIVAREGRGICPEEIYLRYGYYPAKRKEQLQRNFCSVSCWRRNDYGKSASGGKIRIHTSKKARTAQKDTGGTAMSVTLEQGGRVD